MALLSIRDNTQIMGDVLQLLGLIYNKIALLLIFSALIAALVKNFIDDNMAGVVNTSLLIGFSIVLLIIVKNFKKPAMKKRRY